MSKKPAPHETSAAEWVPVESLSRWDRNPKHHGDHDVPDIARSIRRWGFAAPIVAWRSRGQIVAGHGRLDAAMLLLREDPGRLIATDAPGPGLVPVRYVEFASDAEAAAYAIADNRHTEKNPMDPVMVAELYGEYAFDAEGTGYSAHDLDEIAANMALASDAEWGDAAGALPDEDRKPFQAMTFTLHDDQVEVVKAALKAAQPMIQGGGPNTNSNGNALEIICAAFRGSA